LSIGSQRAGLPGIWFGGERRSSSVIVVERRSQLEIGSIEVESVVLVGRDSGEERLQRWLGFIISVAGRRCL